MRPFFPLLMILLSGCACFSHQTDISDKPPAADNELTQLAKQNIATTHRSALIRILSANKINVINADDGAAGYFEYEVSAEIIESFRGAQDGRLTYREWAEAWFDPAILVGKEQIISLCQTQSGVWTTPDQGYALPVELVNVAELRNAKQTGDEAVKATACDPNVR